MKNKMIKICVAIAAIASIGLTVQAVPITGGISFSGNYTPNNTDLSAATLISFGLTTTSVGSTGSFAGIAGGTTVTMIPSIAINPTAPPITALWSVGGITFDALTLVESAVTAQTITLYGTGTLYDGTPADSSAGQWLATFNTISGTFSFSASAGSVPDGGTTVMLLGSALAGLGLLKRKLLS
jgi:hypothetical protein